MRILALDPGEKVGWARASVSDTGEWTDLRHGITPLRDMALAVHCSLVTSSIAPDYDLIVCEDWRLRPDKVKQFAGSSFPSVQFIGMVRLCCWLSGTQLVTQGADIKSTADKTLAKLWPEMHAKVTQAGSHDDQHDLDAIRHLWFWCYKNTTVAETLLSKEAA